MNKPHLRYVLYGARTGVKIPPRKYDCEKFADSKVYDKESKGNEQLPYGYSIYDACIGGSQQKVGFFRVFTLCYF